MNYVKNKEIYGKKSSGRPKLYSARAIRQLIREVNNKQVSSAQAKRSLGLPGTRQTSWYTLKRCPFLIRKKKLKKPNLADRHKHARLEFGRKLMSWTIAQWSNVIFSDEKRFTLDGPDGYSYYWHDLQKEKQYFNTRQQGGGGLFVWGAMGYNGTTELVITEPRMKSKDYIGILQSQLPVYGHLIGGDNFIFQQDNCSFHTANVVRKWLAGKNIQTLDWPSRSPDLNPMENLWGLLVRRVYRDGRQFNSSEDLKKVLIECWEGIEVEYLQKLIESMQNRIFEVIQNNGNSTRY